MSSEIVIYSTKVCPFCVRAKMLLDKKGAKYKEIDASNPEVRQKMFEKAGGRMTVPQIFIGDFHVGGFDDLYALDRSGKLDEFLK
jgi:glutaredoxin 3